VSGYGGAEQEERCAAAGIEMLLLKPVDPEQLRLVLQERQEATAGSA